MPWLWRVDLPDLAGLLLEVLDVDQVGGHQHAATSPESDAEAAARVHGVLEVEEATQGAGIALDHLLWRDLPPADR